MGNVVDTSSVCVEWPPIMAGFSSWFSYLKVGFETLGIPVSTNDALKKLHDDKKASGIIPLYITIDGNKHRVWYDVADFEKDHYERLMEQGDFYFKIQTRADLPLRERFFPIGQIVCSSSYPLHTARLRRLNWRDDKAYDIIHACRATAFDMRVKAAEIILANSRWKSFCVVAHFRNRPEVPESVRGNKLRFMDHMHKQASSKVCLALPGVGGDWTWRHTEIMGIGAFLLTIKPDFILPGNPVDCWGECERDLSDFEEKVDYWLNNDRERLRRAKGGQAYYDRYLSPPAQAKYVIRIIKDSL